MEKRQEYVKIKHSLFRQLDRNRLFGSLAAREAVYLMHLHAITKTFPTHDLHSPAANGTEHTKDVRPQLCLRHATCLPINMAPVSRLKVRYNHLANENAAMNTAE